MMTEKMDGNLNRSMFAGIWLKYKIDIILLLYI